MYFHAFKLCSFKSLLTFLFKRYGIIIFQHLVVVMCDVQQVTESHFFHLVQEVNGERFSFYDSREIKKN